MTAIIRALPRTIIKDGFQKAPSQRKARILILRHIPETMRPAPNNTPTTQLIKISLIEYFQGKSGKLNFLYKITPTIGNNNPNPKTIYADIEWLYWKL